MPASCQVSLHIKGDALDPDLISGILAVQPTRAHRMGHAWTTSGGSGVVEKTGLWRLTVQGDDAEVSALIAVIDRIVMSGGTALASLPGVESAFVDVLLLADVDERGGGTGQLTLDSNAVQILGRLGLPVEFTFAAVVP
jgi:hypothetical protein